MSERFTDHDFEGLLEYGPRGAAFDMAMSFGPLEAESVRRVLSRLESDDIYRDTITATGITP